MYEIKVTTTFSAAHNLENYHGKCEHLHGHNWVVETVFSYANLDKAGMAIDFREAKALAKDATAQFDHAYLNEASVLKGVNPTSENIARIIFLSIKKKNRHVSSVSVWENEGSCATYRERTTR